MKGMLYEEFSRAFINRRYWLVVILAAISFLSGFMLLMNMQNSHLGPVLTWQMILRHGHYGYFAALMAAMPFADSLVADLRHHYIDQVLVRSKFRDYLIAKVLAVGASGLAAVLLPALLLLGFCLFGFPAAAEPVPPLSWGGIEPSITGRIPPGDLEVTSLTAYTVVSLLMAAGFGLCYSLLGLAVSSLVRNSFVVLGFPFLLYCAGSYILPASRRLSWLGSTEAALLPSGGLYPAMVQYLALAVFSLAFMLFFARKERLVLR